jgi:hypothetical protein
LKNQDEQDSDQESQRRFQKLVGIALKTPPKPQKAIGHKGVAAQRKKAKPKRQASKV